MPTPTARRPATKAEPVVAGVRVIAGLGNPGDKYRNTRHNVGAVYVEALAARFSVPLAEDSRFKARIGRGTVLGHDVRLVLPTTYMNESGQSLGALQRFFKLEPADFLVCYDEVAFEPGAVKLKFDGGHNGHNGIKSVIAGFGNRRDFLRLRIGIGHAGHKDRMVAFLTSVDMPRKERDLVDDCLRFDDIVLEHLFRGEVQKAMTCLHAPLDSE